MAAIAGAMDEVEALRNLGNDNKEIFEFLEKQLGVCDTKAAAIISLNGILLALLAYQFVSHWLMIATVALLLLSALFCVAVLRVRWASTLVEFEDSQPNYNKMLELRSKKTGWLNSSIVCLILGLASMAATYVLLYWYGE